MLNIKNNVMDDMNCKLKYILSKNNIPTALALSMKVFLSMLGLLLISIAKVDINIKRV